MVLTVEEKKERKRIYYKNNKEKIALYAKRNYEKNKVKRLANNKIYREENKEKLAKYFVNHNKTPKRIKDTTISKWKRRGLICLDYDSLYCHYLSETYCDGCCQPFGIKGDGTGTFKCMDHDHKSGLFRNFLCAKCNFKRR